MAPDSLASDVKEECRQRLTQTTTPHRQIKEGIHCTTRKELTQIDRSTLLHGKLVTPEPPDDSGGGGRVVEYWRLLTLPHPKTNNQEPGSEAGSKAGSKAGGGCGEGRRGRGWVIAGEAGRGKSTLAWDVANSWCKDELQEFEAVFIINGFDLFDYETWDIIKSQIPITVSKWGGAEIAEWMEKAAVLLIIDDFIPQPAAIQELKNTTEEWNRASFMLLTIPSEAAECRDLLSTYLSTVLLHLEGLEKSDVLHLCSNYLSAQQLDNFRMWLINNWYFCRDAMSYGSLVPPICEAWQLGLISSQKTTTLTEMLWAVVETRLIKCSLLGSGLVEKWISILGKISRRNLESRRLLNRFELESEAKNLFPPEILDDIICYLFPTSSSSASIAVLSLPHPLTQFLAGWDALTRNLQGTPLKSLTKQIADEDPVVIYAAGHLSRILRCKPDHPEKKIIRVAKNLVLHMDRAKDRMGYTLKVMKELNLHPKITQIMKDEVDFPKEWDIGNAAILADPVKCLLDHTTPKKALVTVEKNCEAAELPAVLSALSNAGVPVFLAEMNHLSWENKDTSDNLVRIIQNGKGKLDDFLGCLNSKTISSLSHFEATKNIVCLRVRARDKETVLTALKCPRELPSLMWLEVDFDMKVSEVVKIEVPQVDTPLMDVSFKDMTDQDVPAVCDFLSKIRKRYSGLHLMRSQLSPQGARDVLKIFFRKCMQTTADQSVINRYRRWRFPVLHHIPKTEELTEENALHLIGYDDRNHYSDNEIRSNVITSRIEAVTLSNFFSALENLIFFRYVCANYSIVKKTDGSTEWEEIF